MFIPNENVQMSSSPNSIQLSVLYICCLYHFLFPYLPGSGWFCNSRIFPLPLHIPLPPSFSSEITQDIVQGNSCFNLDGAILILCHISSCMTLKWCSPFPLSILPYPRDFPPRNSHTFKDIIRSLMGVFIIIIKFYYLE